MSINDMLNETITLRCKVCGLLLVLVPAHTGFAEYHRAGSSECYCREAVVSVEVMLPKYVVRVSSE